MDLLPHRRMSAPSRTRCARSSTKAALTPELRAPPAASRHQRVLGARVQPALAEEAVRQGLCRALLAQIGIRRRPAGGRDEAGDLRRRECARAPAAPALSPMGLRMVGPCIMGYGSPELQKAFFLLRASWRARTGYWCAEATPNPAPAPTSPRLQSCARRNSATATTTSSTAPRSGPHPRPLRQPHVLPWCAPGRFEAASRSRASLSCCWRWRRRGSPRRPDHHPGRRPRGQPGVLRQRPASPSPACVGGGGEQGLDGRQVHCWSSSARAGGSGPGLKVALAQRPQAMADRPPSAADETAVSCSIDPDFRARLRLGVEVAAVEAIEMTRAPGAR